METWLQLILGLGLGVTAPIILVIVVVLVMMVGLLFWPVMVVCLLFDTITPLVAGIAIGAEILWLVIASHLE